MEKPSGWTSRSKIRKEESLWEEVQKKTFCGWINMHLKKIGTQITDLRTDLSDGVKLIALLEVLHGKKIEGRYYKNPKSKPYKIDNVNFALNFIKDTLKIKLISCSAEDVVDGNVKIILGMCWRLIQQFQFTTHSSRTVLLNWCKAIASHYDDVTIDNFQLSFEDGRAFCALIHYYNPELFDFSKITEDSVHENLETAFTNAENHLNIPKLLDTIDIEQGLVDERCVMTYVSMIAQAFDSKGIVPVECKKEKSPVVVSSALSTPRAVSVEPSPRNASIAQPTKSDEPVDTISKSEEYISEAVVSTEAKETNETVDVTSEEDLQAKLKVLLDQNKVLQDSLSEWKQKLSDLESEKSSWTGSGMQLEARIVSGEEALKVTLDKLHQLELNIQELQAKLDNNDLLDDAEASSDEELEADDTENFASLSEQPITAPSPLEVNNQEELKDSPSELTNLEESSPIDEDQVTDQSESKEQQSDVQQIKSEEPEQQPESEPEQINSKEQEQQEPEQQPQQETQELPVQTQDSEDSPVTPEETDQPEGTEQNVKQSEPPKQESESQELAREEITETNKETDKTEEEDKEENESKVTVNADQQEKQIEASDHPSQSADTTVDSDLEAPADEKEEEEEEEEIIEEEEEEEEVDETESESVQELRKQYKLICKKSAKAREDADNTRDRLRQQVKVSETLQKSLEDTREETLLIQKRQKRTLEKALKKQQKRYDKRIQRRDREITNLKNNHQVDLEQKTNEIEAIKKQLRSAQKTLGDTIAPESEDVDKDIDFLKLEKNELMMITKCFEEEEENLATRKMMKRVHSTIHLSANVETDTDAE